MIQQNINKSLLTATLRNGPNPEPEIDSKRFLNSFLEYSCWSRSLIARQSFLIISGKEYGELEKLAALVSFYQNIGVVIEDALTTYIAWSLWANDKSQKIPNILNRIVLKLTDPKKQKDVQTREEIIKKFQESDRQIIIYARHFLQETLQCHDNDIPNRFGINWKKNPSVKLVTRDQLEFWNNLGSHIRESLNPLLDPKNDLIASCYNKIKHGPQIIIDNLQNSAISRGYSDDQIKNLDLDKKTIRFLLDGARTQDTDEEQASSKRCAPFLISDTENIQQILYKNIYYISTMQFIHGTWLYNSTYIKDQRPFTPKYNEIQEIIKEAMRFNKF